MKVAVVYGSTTGTTEGIAKKIANMFDNSDLFDVDQFDFKTLTSYDLIILGTSTWGIGDLQDDWESNLYKLSDIDLSGKYVALFGLGDQEGYEDSFIDGVDTIYKEVVKLNPTVIGFTSTEGYSHSDSQAVKDNQFIGLAIDEDTQGNLTDDRIFNWVEQIKKEVK